MKNYLFIKSEFYYIFIITFVVITYFFVINYDYYDKRVIAFFGFLLLSLIILTLSFVRFNLFNPFVYLLPVIPYFLLSILSGSILEQEYFSFIMLLYCIGCISIWIGWKLAYIFGDIKKSYFCLNPDIKFFFFSALLSFCIIFIGSFLLKFENKTFNAIGLITTDLFEATFFGCLIAVFMRSRRLFYFLVFLFIFKVGYFDIAIHGFDSNRFSMVVILAFILISEVFLRREYRAVTVTVTVSSILVLVFLGWWFYSQISVLLGGDGEILSNVEWTVWLVDNNEYSAKNILMPFYNAGLLFIPDGLWFFGDKPSAFNPSAWYIENVMGMGAYQYPWGIGLGGVGAAYLYGKYFGVIAIYLLAGVFIGWLMRMCRGGYGKGVVIYYCLLLPFSLFRMDETFLFGFAFVTIPFLYFTFLISRKYAG